MDVIKKCVEENDLAIFGVSVRENKYAIIHHIGRREDVEKTYALISKSADSNGLDKKNLFIAYYNIDFSKEELQKLLQVNGYFAKWCEERS